MGLRFSERNGTENILGSFPVTRTGVWSPSIYNIYFTDRRIIFAKLGGAGTVPNMGGSGGLLASLVWVATEEGRQKKRSEAQGGYERMWPQEIADCKDNVGVPYDDVSSVTIKGRSVPEIIFVFLRKQKLGWEKASFILYGDSNTYNENLRSAGVLLRRFLPYKLDNQLQDTKYSHLRKIFENL
jgi:hypothetical protein